MRVLIAGVALAALCAGAVVAQDNSSSDLVDRVGDLPTYRDVGLRWERGPSIRDLARQHRVGTDNFPARGVAELACTPDVEGRLDCSVVSEYPTDDGFGSAALRVMRPVQVSATDGYSPAGRTFGFRLRFGNWPEDLLPDNFHPTEQGLRWVKRPELAGARLAGLGFFEEARADLECQARADGSLDCQARPVSNASPGFMEAVMASMEEARVERVDGDPVAGSPLKWTIRLVNQAHCGGGARSDNVGLGQRLQGQGANHPDPTTAGLSGGPPIGGSTEVGGAFRQGTGGGCIGSIVQVH